MEPSERGALSLVRLIAVLLIVVTVLDLGLYWVKCFFAKPALPVEVLPCLSKLIPAVLGFAGLICARRIAEWISNQLDG